MGRMLKKIKLDDVVRVVIGNMLNFVLNVRMLMYIRCTRGHVLGRWHCAIAVPCQV